MTPGTRAQSAGTPDGFLGGAVLVVLGLTGGVEGVWGGAGERFQIRCSWSPLQPRVPYWECLSATEQDLGWSWGSESEGP